MSSDPRALLADVPPAKIPTPKNFVAILRRDAEGEDVDLDAVDAWVKDNGGTIRRTQPSQAQLGGGSRQRQQTFPAELYYVLPREALRG